MDTKTIGKWSLVAGIALALINAFVELEFLADFPLGVILGLVAGILYLSTDDATGYYILTAAVGALGGSLGDFFGLGQYVTDWMTGSAVVLGAGAVALIIRTFVNWAKP